MHEQDMIALLQQHDERGMDALLLHCGPLMRYIIAPIVPNALDREECLSEASLRVWNKIAQFDAARGSWSAWLTAVTRNTALNFQRSAARHGDAQTLPEDAPSPEASPEEALIQAERRAALHDALAQLGQNDRALFYRKYYYLQSTAQIAAELGMTERAVEGRLYRLKKRLRAVRRKAGLPAQGGGAGALLAWYVLMCVLAAVHYTGLLVPIAMLVGYVCILRSLFRLSRALDEAGYAIAPQPVRVTDWCIALVLAAALGIGCTLGYLFGGSYRMDWQPADASEQTQTAAIRQQLLDLGFPEAVLNDLTPEDIAACDGALRVVSVTEDHPFNDGRTVSHKQSDGEGGVVSVLDTVYDVRELRLTSVGVQLPGAQETWRVYHHFLWTTDPGFYGTEALQIWPADQSTPDGWRFAGDVTGRVLHDRDGQTFTASYHTLGRQTYTADSVFFGQRTNSDLFAPFSMPRHAESARGYVAYTAAAAQSGYLLSSWCNYTHQQSLLQYPAVTAMEKRMTSAFGNAGAFYTVQHALQFFPEDAELLR